MTDLDPGHRLRFLAEEHSNGTYALPEKLHHTSQMERSIKVRGKSGIPAEMQELLDVHNMYRCMHNVPPMTWDATIAANAQAWADNGHYGHTSQANRTLPTIGYIGENLAWGYPTRSGKDSVAAWYDEIKFTDGTPTSCQDTNPDSTGDAICHYTQVVWKSSTKLGCGMGSANVGGQIGDFWVCQYGPGGNIGGHFLNEVLAPEKTMEECRSAAPSPSCADGAPHVDPIIKYSNGETATCVALGWACPHYGFVQAKCKMTCGSC